MHLTYEEALKELNLKSGFTADELKKAYRKRAVETHPDTNINANKEEFQRVSAAKELLSRFLEDPIAYEKERKQEEEKKKKKEEERKRQEEEQKKQEEEKRKKEAEEKKKQDEIKKSIYYRFAACPSFSKLNISLDKILTNDNAFQILKTLSNMADELYRSKENTISMYNRRHKSYTPSLVSPIKDIKRNNEKRQLRNNFESRINNDFETKESSLESVIKYYLEYFPYGEILNKCTYTDLRTYILYDDIFKQKLKNTAVSRLEKYFMFMEPIIGQKEHDTFIDVNNTKYRSTILSINTIMEFINENYDGFYSKLKPTASKEAIMFFNNLKTFWPNKNNYPRASYEDFIMVNWVLVTEIHKKIPDPMFNIGTDMTKLAIISKDTKSLQKYYSLTKNNYNITYYYEIATKLKDNFNFKGMNLYDFLIYLIALDKQLTTINKFGKTYTLEELASLNKDELNKLIHTTKENDKQFEQLIKKDKKYLTYQKIYIKYNKQFENTTFINALEIIKNKCDYLESLTLNIPLETLYGYNDEQLKKASENKKRDSMVRFIQAYHPDYKDQEERKSYEDRIREIINENVEINISKNDMLNFLDYNQLEELYNETLVIFINENNKNFKNNKITKEILLELSDSEIQLLINDTYRQLRITYLVTTLNKKYKEEGKDKVTYESIDTLTDEELFDLELDAFAYNEQQRYKNSTNKKM